MLVYTEIEANLFINRYFAESTNKDEIFEFFVWVWNDSNLQNAKMLCFSKFKK
jgi:hypothetical protein